MANYVLEILDGDRAGEVLAVGDRPVRIGRKPGNDLVLPDEKTSGVHAEVVPEGDRHVLRDLGSTNGTFLDGKRVTEIVLTPGDVVTIGRLRVQFRAADAGAAEAAAVGVTRLDTGRLRGRGGSAGLLLAVLALAIGVGGWFWWQGRSAADPETPGAAKVREPLVVPGNKLSAALAGCETDAGWQLRAGGGGWQSTGEGHTGAGAFQALRGEAGAGGDAADFAVLRLAEPLPVFSSRAMTIAAHVATRGGAQVAVRAIFAAANEQLPFRFCSGTPLQAVEGWQRIESVLAVPPGCDRLLLEVVAILPTADARALVDDVAVVEGGAASALELKLADGSQTAIGTGAALAIRSVDAEAPATLLELRPDRVPEPLQGLHRAGLAVLSDLGCALQCTANERGFALRAPGVQGLQVVLPAEAAGGLAVAGDDGAFVSTAADSEFRGRAVLVGDRATRALLTVPEVQTWRGRTGGGRFRVSVPGDAIDVVLSFRAEMQQAAELVRQARRARDDGRPGEALDRLAVLFQTLPMDTEQLAQAGALRAEILAAQAAALAALARDLEEAAFFSTRGGFERVVQDVAELRRRYGEHNLEDRAAVAAIHERAAAQLRAIDGELQGRQRAQLQALAQAFGDARQPGLQALVQQYLDRHLAPK
jgi:hypothetical protein